MAKTEDLVFDDKTLVQLGVFPKLGLIIVNDLRDFAENWIEVIVTQDSQFKVDMNVRTLSGHSDDGLIEGFCRYLIETLIKKLNQNFEFRAEKVGTTTKFIVNINLRREILHSKNQLEKVREALVSLYQRE